MPTDPLSRGAAQELARDALAAARRAARGADARVVATSTREANTRFARSEITSTGDSLDTTVAIEIAFGRRHAQALTNQIDARSLTAAAERAARLARLAPEDPEQLPPLPRLPVARVEGAHDRGTAALGAAARADAIAASIAAGDAAKLDIAGYFDHEEVATAVATSAGQEAFHLRTAARFTTTARTPDGTGSGWAGRAAVAARDLDAPALARAAVERGARSAKPSRLEPGAYTVVLEPAAVGALMAFLGSALNARAADEGRSFFSKPGGGNRVGETLLHPSVTLASDPTSALTPGLPFDDDGLPLPTTTWIERGTVRGLVTSRYWAGKSGRKPTGTPTVWSLAGGEAASIDALVAGVERGLWVTRFWYIRMLDPQQILVTGLTRDGVFLIENGKVTRPVNNFRWNESPVEMLRKVEAMTRDTFFVPSTEGGGPRPVWRVPALRMNGFRMSTISEAV